MSELPWPADHVERRPLAALVPYARNARVHSPQQVSQIAASMREWGFTIPVLVDEKDEIIAGHGRVMAAFELGFEAAPVMVAKGWTQKQIRAYRIADNQLALNAAWDVKLLAAELEEFPDLSALVGVSDREMMRIINKGGRNVEWLGDPEAIPELPLAVTSKRGDIWQMGEHRLMCGSSIVEADRAALLEGRRPQCCLTDFPYGLGGTVSKKNKYQQYDDSKDNLAELVAVLMPVLIDLCERVVLTPGNWNVWRYPRPTWTMAWFTPSNTGRGPWGFSVWQPILCYGKDPKLQNGMGSYPDALVQSEIPPQTGHPCAKPVGVWEWLTERVSNKGEMIFEPFAGSGTTLITGTMKGNPVLAMEISPAYCDVCVTRWQDFTGEKARLNGGPSFDDVAGTIRP